MALRRGELAKATETAILRPTATVADADAVCAEARQLHLGGVCVLPFHVAHVAGQLKGSDVRVIALISFPFGADTGAVKAVAAARAVQDGALDVEVVMGTARFLSGDLGGVRDELVAVRRAMHDAAGTTGREPLLRAVIETGYLDDRRIRLAARTVLAARVDGVVASTGLGPQAATRLDVELLREEVGPGVLVKAAGTVRTLEEAQDSGRSRCQPHRRHAAGRDARRGAGLGGGGRS